jgi:hypothetical protein
VFGLSPMQWFCMDLVLYSAVVLTLKRPVRQPIPPGAIS